MQMRNSEQGPMASGEIVGGEITPEMIAANKKRLLNKAETQKVAHEAAVGRARRMSELAGKGDKSAVEILDEAGDALRRSNELAAARRRVKTAGGENGRSAS